ncbi:hypothetical protein JCM10450v2_003480 [Rhodotorula kratochvilovae]
MARPSPPHTPVSSLAPSFLSFSPEAPRTPSNISPYTPSIHDVDTTPRACRLALVDALKQDAQKSVFRLEPPPASRRRARKEPPALVLSEKDERDALQSSAGSFGSRNPFAAILAKELAEESSGSSGSSRSARSSSSSANGASPATATSSSSSSMLTPTHESAAEDDLIVYDGTFVMPAPSSAASGWSGVSVVTLDASFDALGLGDDGDISSAWEDELYSSLSEASPVELAFPPRIPRLEFQAPSPEQKARAARDGAGSPRRARKTATTSPRHPYRRSSTAAPTSPSPKRTALSALSSPELDAFQLDPTSPIQRLEQCPTPPKLLPFGLRTLPASLTRPRFTSPPKPSSSSPHALESKDSRRTAKRAARAERDRVADARARERAKDGIDMEELDRFFGITPKRGKALRGGYADVADAEGVVGAGGVGRSAEDPEDKAWRKVEEFRGLLDAAGDEDDDAMDDVVYGGMTSEDDAELARSSGRRRPPPPLHLASSSTVRARSASVSSSIISFDDAASALDARITLASPIDLSSVSLPALLPPHSPSSTLASPTLLQPAGPALSDTVVVATTPRSSSLPNKRGVGTRIKGLCGGLVSGA